jgi:hypothetical protein
LIPQFENEHESRSYTSRPLSDGLGYRFSFPSGLGNFAGALMQGEDRERWRQLAEQVLVEQDRKKLLALVKEIDGLLAKKQVRLNRLTADSALPEHIAFSPVTLLCPRCNAGPGAACYMLDGVVALIHLERIEAAV